MRRLDEHAAGELDRYCIRGLHDVRGGEHLAVRTDEHARSQSGRAYFMRIGALPGEDALASYVRQPLRRRRV